MYVYVVACGINQEGLERVGTGSSPGKPVAYGLKVSVRPIPDIHHHIKTAPEGAAVYSMCNGVNRNGITIIRINPMILSGHPRSL